LPTVAQHLWDHDVWVRGKLLQEEHLLCQTGPGALPMWSLDLQHEVVVKHIDTGLPASLINAGDRRAAPAMAPHKVKHRPLIQHGISGIGLAVYITGEHDASLVRILNFLPWYLNEVYITGEHDASLVLYRTVTYAS
jgi:hypothetical protein